MSSTTALPILPTPGLDHPRFTRLRFMTADAGAAGTPGVASGDAGTAATGVDSGAAGTTDTSTAGDAGSQADQGADADSPWNDPAKAKAEIERLRRENGADRTNAKQTAAQEARDAVVQDIAKALGLAKEETPPDPAALATAAQEAKAETEGLRGENRSLKTELAAFKAAVTLGANAVELLDRRSVNSQLDKLDPTADDFATQVDAIVKKAVTDNPQLLVQAPVAGASSTDHAGGSGEGVAKPANLEEAIAANMARGR